MLSTKRKKEKLMVMKNALLKAAVAFLFAVAISLSLFPSKAWAGDFSKSCYNSEVKDSVLYSNCRRINGSYNNTKIDLNPFIENVDGVLKWQPRNFIQTCRNTALSGSSVMVAQCKKRNQVWNDTSIDLDDRIANIDGNLQYQSSTAPGENSQVSVPVYPVVLAKYTFDRDIPSEKEYPNDSVQEYWKTSNLVDNATGTGAMGKSNLDSFNSTLRAVSDGQYLALSSNREGDAGRPTGDIGESTWFTFSIDLMGEFDFSGQEATVDTYAFSGLGGTTSTNWTLYYSVDGGSSFTSLGTKEGQTANANSGLVGPQTISWDLTPIAVQSGKIDFLLDPVSTGATNGVINQRSTGFDNLIVKALPQL